jgi:NADPH-dependent curcumin reductase CurA
MLEIGEPKEGETVVVSAAAGAVGSVAGQLAKMKGARVVGIAGGPEKCAFLTDTLGFDAAVDYKADDWREQLKAATPDGIDVNFENVGGEIMEAVMARLNIRARMVLCGLISGYNEKELPPGPRTFGNLLINRVKLQGFIILDYYPRFGEAIRDLSQWIAEGKIRSEETVVEGFEQLPDALNMLFRGENMGKLVVHIEA